MKKRELGDFQTPQELSELLISLLKNKKISTIIKIARTIDLTPVEQIKNMNTNIKKPSFADEITSIAKNILKIYSFQEKVLPL